MEMIMKMIIEMIIDGKLKSNSFRSVQLSVSERFMNVVQSRSPCYNVVNNYFCFPCMAVGV